jgi:pilus assembly protein Flp/PilA
MSIMNKLRVFKSDESGASMVEYGIALLVVAAIGVGLMSVIGTATAGRVEAACDNVILGNTGTATGLTC